MKVKMLKSHQGRETNEMWYDADDVVDLADDMAMILIANGWAEEIERRNSDDDDRNNDTPRRGRRQKS